MIELVDLDQASNALRGLGFDTIRINRGRVVGELRMNHSIFLPKVGAKLDRLQVILRASAPDEFHISARLAFEAGPTFVNVPALWTLQAVQAQTTGGDIPLILQDLRCNLVNMVLENLESINTEEKIRRFALAAKAISLLDPVSEDLPNEF